MKATDRALRRMVGEVIDRWAIEFPQFGYRRLTAVIRLFTGWYVSERQVRRATKRRRHGQ